MKIFSRVILPTILIIYIGVETILKLQDSSLCDSTGCKLAGELLRFNSIYLNIFGMMGAGAIIFAGIKSLKSEIWERLFFITLYSAIAFEGIMIAYQILVNPEPCKFCIGVFSLLLLTGILANMRYFIHFLPILLAVLSAISTLNVPKNEHLIEKDGIYLIHSNRCPHCLNVKNYFKEHSIDYKGIEVPSTTAKFFANVLNINQIPIVLIKSGKKIEVIYGDEPIIDSFEEKSRGRDYRDEVKSEGEERGSLFQKDNDGCSISLTGDEDCDSGKGGIR
jgi:glutaredoxin